LRIRTLESGKLGRWYGVRKQRTNKALGTLVQPVGLQGGNANGAPLLSHSKFVCAPCPKDRHDEARLIIPSPCLPVSVAIPTMCAWLWRGCTCPNQVSNCKCEVCSRRTRSAATSTKRRWRVLSTLHSRPRHRVQVPLSHHSFEAQVDLRPTALLLCTGTLTGARERTLRFHLRVTASWVDMLNGLCDLPQRAGALQHWSVCHAAISSSAGCRVLGRLPCCNIQLCRLCWRVLSTALCSRLSRLRSLRSSSWQLRGPKRRVSRRQHKQVRECFLVSVAGGQGLWQVAPSHRALSHL
jgi:hypothetical protein